MELRLRRRELLARDQPHGMGALLSNLSAAARLSPERRHPTPHSTTLSSLACISQASPSPRVPHSDLFDWGYFLAIDTKELGGLMGEVQTYINGAAGILTAVLMRYGRTDVGMGEFIA